LIYNPHILALKFFILLSIGGSLEINQKGDFDDFVIEKLGTFNAVKQITLPQENTTGNHQHSIMHKHQMMNKQKLAIFCKMEHEVMKSSGFAVKFRLGDQTIVDQLEGK